MKKSILAVAFALFVTTLASAATSGQFRIKVPVAFTVAGSAMPAGEYSIEQVSPAGVLQITNTVTGSSAMVIGNPISNSATPAAKVTLTKATNGYALETVALPSGAAYELRVNAPAR